MPEHAVTPETRRELDEMLRQARAMRDQAKLELVRKRSAASRPHRPETEHPYRNKALRTALVVIALAALTAAVALAVPDEFARERLLQLGRQIETALPWRQPPEPLPAEQPPVMAVAAPTESARPARAPDATAALATTDDRASALARQTALVREAAELRFARRLAEWQARHAP